MPVDAFVRILVLERDSPPLCVRPGLTRAGYRELVIDACCPEFGPNPRKELAERCPEDPGAAEDLLYQLCIEVNPALDIHTVRLFDDERPPAPMAHPRQGPRGTSDADDRDPGREDEDGPGDEATAGGHPATGRGKRGAAPQESPREAARRGLARHVRGLERKLAERVVGQSSAIARLLALVRRAAAGLADERRPLGTALFVGRTGTGKTELARALADELFGPGALVRVDCSEFSLGHETARLSGAPPGYVGHENGGFLTDALERRPDCVVLFDEVEKAHPRLHHLLLQVLDDGHMTDGRGKRVDFTRAFVVLTSNAGAVEAADAARRLGFGSRAPAGPQGQADGTLGEEALAEIVSQSLSRQFTPEFLGRVGSPILFRELDRGDALQIAERLLFLLALRLRQRGFSVAFAPSVARWLVERGFNADRGARELEHTLARELESPLCEHLLSAQGRGLVRVSIQRGKPRIARAA
jgi:hypothetical protein